MAKAPENVKKMSDSVDTWKRGAKAAARKWKENVQKGTSSSAYNQNVAISAGVSESDVAGGAGASWRDFAANATQKQYVAGIDKPDAGEKLVSGYAQGVVKKKR